MLYHHLDVYQKILFLPHRFEQNAQTSLQTTLVYLVIYRMILALLLVRKAVTNLVRFIIYWFLRVRIQFTQTADVASVSLWIASLNIDFKLLAVTATACNFC
jgi:hypothetical protein